MTLEQVQKEQAEYDKKFWEHDRGFETIRHSSHHIGKLMGKIAGYCEESEHGELASTKQLDEEVIPDLLIYAVRLANDRGLTLDQVFEKRKEELVKRFSK